MALFPRRAKFQIAKPKCKIGIVKKQERENKPEINCQIIYAEKGLAISTNGLALAAVLA